ncbi:dTMP kinase OS=Tsukamurella paurometabola (strain ATCC 8368 / DSM / CCUG 35730 / CIP 100753/ JCM 10117 / KCTC 9821 / NBRC 16120 / NCIMB 702349 / NCTC 13040)OX=521096 GN=Tpau_1075 PE=3 SV=1 [Tsukamurella paurometabola]|uniref:Thymidylate kinase n=1 Tax=Tsukamurella paurometabola (strain ATCC 8368 / DSM 20162 / CCUG 35730 / CIP 100753 / JCM 10117 / KCTC 9821 / NBRC 16120 / NCIMB 702349 / NCTC 13040) TaxID=521096 RepID=D5UVB7_TSUPD|nr:dTMP kinase [Tsukamurella paurometabola]ADG77707.1 thymidylate kinase [Tsukamurella paurometabola DSM 20162]SUP28398.1 Thymidylate kinase [Tsukamurella paurometabola]
MGTLVAVEGLDGAGKNTLTRAVTQRLTDRGLTVAALAFPRYGRSIHADLAAEALHGGHGDATASVYGMGLLFALDRRGAADEIRGLLAGHDVVLLDRYAASSAAYSAARLGEDAHGAVATWVRELEFERFGVPVPDLQVYLDVPVAVAAARAKGREAHDATRARDVYEKDAGLQARTGAVYAGLAAAQWVSPWRVHGVDDAPELLADAIANPS